MVDCDLESQYVYIICLLRIKLRLNHLWCIYFYVQIIFFNDVKYNYVTNYVKTHIFH